MVKDTPYIVPVRELPAHRKFEIPSTTVTEWLKGLPMRDALGAPDPDPDAGHGAADLDLYVDGTHAFASGTFKGYLTVACSRCVGPVRLNLDETLRVTFMPPGEMPSEDNEPAAQSAPGNDGGPGEGEGALVAEEDLDVFAYDGEKIDLEPLFREQFVLAIPYAPLCAETCKGLCPQCGIDLNSGTCTCEKPIDPRLAALKGLKLPS
jgi:uncharacterized protein